MNRIFRYLVVLLLVPCLATHAFVPAGAAAFEKQATHTCSFISQALAERIVACTHLTDDPALFSRAWWRSLASGTWNFLAYDTRASLMPRPFDYDKKFDLRRDADLDDMLSEVQREIGKQWPTSSTLGLGIDSPVCVLPHVLMNAAEALTTNWRNPYRHTLGLEYAGSVRVRFYRQNGRRVIEVTDNGTGIEKTVLDKLFIKRITTRPEPRQENHGGFGDGIFQKYTAFVQRWNGQIEIVTRLYNELEGWQLTYTPQMQSPKLVKASPPKPGSTVRLVFPVEGFSPSPEKDARAGILSKDQLRNQTPSDLLRYVMEGKILEDQMQRFLLSQGLTAEIIEKIFLVAAHYYETRDLSSSFNVAQIMSKKERAAMTELIEQLPDIMRPFWAQLKDQSYLRTRVSRVGARNLQLCG